MVAEITPADTPQYVAQILNPSAEVQQDLNGALLPYALAKKQESIKIGDQTIEYSPTALLQSFSEGIGKAIQKYRSKALKTTKRFFGLLGKKTRIVDHYSYAVLQALRKMRDEMSPAIHNAYSTVTSQLTGAANQIAEQRGRFDKFMSDLYSV